MDRYKVFPSGELGMSPTGNWTPYADAQATVEALQRVRDEAIREHGKESGFWGRSCARLLDKRDELQAALTPVEGGQDE